MLTSGPQDRWTLAPEAPKRTDASLTLTADAGWRGLTGVPLTPADYQWTGPNDLPDALLHVRGILA